MSKAFVAILMGSENDLGVMKAAAETLDRLGVAHEVNVLSAHRTPELTQQYVAEACQRGAEVFIAAAGMAAHLAGAVAAHTIRPVIGVPLDAGTLGGLDALLSTVQMPGGVPVATVSIGKAGAVNAAILAAQILAVNDDDIGSALLQQRRDKQQSLVRANAALKEEA